MEAMMITTPTNPISADLASSTEPVASTSTSASKPLSRANATIFSKKPQSRVGNQQPSAAELEKLGIKVRDFAYEKTLPPVRTVHLHRQILPGVARQTIARQKSEKDASQSQQSRSQPKTVDRTPTEPSLTPAPPKGARGLFDIEESDDENTTESPTPSNARIPQILFDLQEPQSRVDTPITSSKCLLNRNSQNLQAPALSNSQPSFPHIQPTSSTSRQHLPSIQSSLLPPVPSSPNLHALPPSSIPHRTPSNGARTLSSTSLNHRTNSTKELRPPTSATTPKVISPRYHFRKRPAAPLAPTKPSKQPRKYMSPEKCNAPEFSTTVSAKSTHSLNKPQEETGSPSSRTFHQRSATSKRKRT